MRLEFIHPGRAEGWFKIAKAVLATAVDGPVELIHPMHRIRNAMCRGFGYSSFNELEWYFFQRSNTAKHTSPSTDEILQAFSIGFRLALSDARDIGFSHKANEKELTARLAKQTVELINICERPLPDERELLIRLYDNGEQNYQAGLPRAVLRRAE